MKSGISKVSFSNLLSCLSDIKHYREDLILSHKNYSYSRQILPIFKYPIQIDGVIVIFLSEGIIRGNINLNKYELFKNQLFIGKPGDILQTDTAEATAHCLLISSAFIQEMQIHIQTLIPAIIQLSRNPIFMLTSEELTELTFYHNLLQKNIDETGTYQREIILRLTAAFLFRIGNMLHCRRDDFLSLENNTLNRENLIFNRFIEMLSEAQPTDRRVDFYAQKLFLSPKYFSSVIKKISGKSAGKWIDDYIILQAKSLLKYSGMSIQEIAYHLNFPNPSFFGKFFKLHTGMSPGSYKSQL